MTVSARTDILRTAAARKLLLGFFLAVITVALYSPVRHYQFVSYDDGLYITDNFRIKYGLTRGTGTWRRRLSITRR